MRPSPVREFLGQEKYAIDCRGANLYIHDTAVVIDKTGGGLWNLGDNNFKVIPFKSIVAVQAKLKSTVLSGYIEFETVLRPSKPSFKGNDHLRPFGDIVGGRVPVGSLRSTHRNGERLLDKCALAKTRFSDLSVDDTLEIVEVLNLAAAGVALPLVEHTVDAGSVEDVDDWSFHAIPLSVKNKGLTATQTVPT